MTTTFPCPSCGERLEGPRDSCPECGIALSGPTATRLWQVDQQLAALHAERGDLLARLRAESHGGTGAMPFYPRYPAAPRSGAEPVRRGLSGQQVTLGLGALLLLSAASLFMVVAWFLVGLVGQAVILATLTAAAVAVSRLALRRRLPAVAETAAVIAVGLTLLGAQAAHARGLAGLDRVPDATYGALALLVCGALFVAFDLAVPRAGERGGVLTFAPAAAAALSGAVACTLAALHPTGLTLQVALGAAAAGLGTGALLTWRGAGRASTRVAAAVAGVAAAAAAGGFAAVGLDLAYGTQDRVAVRLAAAALLLGVAAATRWTPVASLAPSAVAATVGLLVPAAMLESSYGADAVGAVVLAGLSVALLRGWRGWHGWREGGRTTGVRPSAVCAVWLQVVLLVLVADGGRGDAAVRASLDGPMPWWAPVVPAAGLLVMAAWGLWLFRSAGWIPAVQAALAVTAGALLWHATATAAFVALLALMVVEAAVAVGAVREPRVLAWLSARPGNAALLDRTAVLGAALCFGSAGALVRPAAAEVAASAADLTAIACWTAAAATSAYAGQRGRLAFGYLASVLASCGSWALLDQADVSVVEAYTLPPALLLGLVGTATWTVARREGRHVGSLRAMGPALGVALGPSTLVAVTDGDVLRLVLVTLAGTACVIGGFTARLKAPVLAGTAVLGLVAITQGGPYLAYVPGWVTIGTAGAVLLAVGASWERAVVTGRRGAAWLSTLA